MKIEKILLPFDGSIHSVNAAKRALQMAKLTKAHVTIIHCYDWSGNISDIPDMPASMVETLIISKKQEAEKILNQAKEIFEAQEVEFELESVSGSPGYVLTNRSKSKEYDLIIMGSHGHSDIAGLFLGSVTHKVLNTIYCPVMIVP